MFLGLSSGKTTLINHLNVAGRQHGYALLQRAIRPISVFFLFAEVSVTGSLAAETAAMMSIEYGTVATYHRVDWDHPQLPIDIVRGMPPAVIEDTQEDTASAGSTDSNQAQMVNGDNSHDTDEHDAPETLPAILYEIDLGEQGMLSIISSQRSVEPGHCAAIERGDGYLNLRRVHVEFCNPANQPLTPPLTRYHRDIAALCQTTKNQPPKADKVDETETARRIAQVSMLCDG